MTAGKAQQRVDPLLAGVGLDQLRKLLVGLLQTRVQAVIGVGDSTAVRRSQDMDVVDRDLQVNRSLRRREHDVCRNYSQGTSHAVDRTIERIGLIDSTDGEIARHTQLS